MSGCILVADAQQIAGQHFLAGAQKGLSAAALDAADEEPGSGLLTGGHGVLRPLRQEMVMGPGTAQGARQKMQGVFFRLGVGSVIAQQPITGHDVINIVRPFLAAFNLPDANLGNTPQDFHQHVQAQIQAGKITAGLPILGVHPPAGLHAPAPQPALAAQKAAPVAPSGNPVAQGAVNKHLEAEIRRTGGSRCLDLIHRELPR